MPHLSDVSMVPVQGGYIAKQCPVVIQNRILVPTEEAESPPEAIHRMYAGVTDGLENASSDFTRPRVFSMVPERREGGWVFVFLGADQDTYAEGGKVGVAASNRVSWEKSKAGSKKLWKDVAYSTSTYQTKADYLRRRDRDRFYEEDPDTE